MEMSRRAVLAAGGAALAGLGARRAWAVVQPGGGQPGGDQPSDPNARPIASARVHAFERMAYGLFLHFGLYSQYGKGEWALHLHKIDAGEYFAKMKTFTAADFDGRAIAKLARECGFRYITLTSRHHDGFSLYDTKGLSTRDVTRTAAGRDVVKDFVEGCRAEGVTPMLYHTTLDWTDERFKADFPAYLEYLRRSVEVLCTGYGPIGGFWFDGNWSNDKADWEEDKLYAVIRKHQPEAMIINNTGIGEGGRLGNPEIDSVTFERARPTPMDRRGHAKHVAAEMCHTVNFHWGIAENDFNYLSPAHVIEELCLARRAGANLLMNVGPTATGGIPEYEAALLRKVGRWIEINGGGRGPVYNGFVNEMAGEGRDFTLDVDGDLFAFVFDLTLTSDTRAEMKPRGPGPRVFKNVPAGFAGAEWMDTKEEVKFAQDESAGTLTLDVPKYPYGTNMVVRVARLWRP